MWGVSTECPNTAPSVPGDSRYTAVRISKYIHTQWLSSDSMWYSSLNWKHVQVNGKCNSGKGLQDRARWAKEGGFEYSMLTNLKIIITALDIDKSPSALIKEQRTIAFIASFHS